MDKQEMSHLTILEAPEGFDPIESQKELQRKIMANRVAEYVAVADEKADTQGLLTELVAGNITAIQMELAELLDWLPWKSWKNYDGQEYDSIDSIATEMKYEVVDVAHFLFNIAIALGMDWKEFLDIFATKQAENHARQDRGY